jgi:hypothetical protein
LPVTSSNLSEWYKTVKSIQKTTLTFFALKPLLSFILYFGKIVLGISRFS